MVKVFHAALDTGGGQERAVVDVFYFGFFTRLARQDHDFSHDVGSAEVESRIRFGISFRLGLAYYFGERPFAGVVVEDEIKGAAEYCLNAVYFVAAAQQVVEGADDGKTGAYIGFEQEARDRKSTRLNSSHQIISYAV